jgi:CHAT domain-containing protein/Tfp pilus assembly protein PilF
MHLKTMLALALLLAPGSLQAQLKPAPKAKATAATLDAAAATAAVVAQAKRLRQGGQFAPAQALLTAKLKSQRSPASQKALRMALADVHFYHARSLATSGRFEAAIPHFRAAYEIDRVLRPRDAALDLDNIGGALGRLGRHEDALHSFQEALVLFRKQKNPGGEGRTLDNIGFTLRALHRFPEALRHFEQALPLRRQANDWRGVGSTLNSIGAVHDTLGNREEALLWYEQGLEVWRALKDRANEGTALNNIGSLYTNLGRYGDALKYLQQALPAMRDARDRSGEAIVLTNIGRSYALMSRHEDALGHYRQALEIQREARDHASEAITLNNIGTAHDSLGRQEEALQNYGEALLILRALRNRLEEGTTLHNIAQSHYKLGRPDEAMKYFGQALMIHREIGDRVGEGSVLSNLGVVAANQGRAREALGYYAPALAIHREVGSREREALTLHNLMLLWRDEGAPRLAIFYGKQSVNVSQEMRRNIRTLDRESQRAFLQSAESVYRTLADLLIAQDRLDEAQQVLGMLKEEEFFQFVRRSASQTDGLNGRATLSPREAQAESAFNEAAAQVTRSGARRGLLLAKPSLSAAEEKELQAAETELEAANRAFEKFLDDLEKQFGQTAQAGRVDQLKDAQGLQETLRELGHGAVALYTLAGEDKVRVMLVTPDARTSSEYAIKREDLNRKVLALRRVLQNPNRDPRPLAQEMYRILVGPLAKALEAAGAKTLMWSLDGPLRYLPVAALHDGDKYLAQSFGNTIFTPASTSNLKDDPGSKWRALGLGVTKEKPGFAALPSVADELRGIVTAEGQTGGILPGTIALDDGFTEPAMKTALRQRPALVHIASHFQFQPGDETTSFLLLGDGSHLSLDKIKNLSFGGVKLLTLSACDTASGGTSADGTEVEGFAVMAQRQGAQAVLASLWPVADSSTQQLMHAFYRVREGQPGTPKSEALRQAQLALLTGTAQPAAQATVVAATEERGAARGLQPKFEVDPKAPFAHPYFWAPFVLIGNWK